MNQNVIELKWMRIAMLLVALTFVVAVIGLLASDSIVRLIMITVAMAFLIGAQAVRKKHLTCSQCGKGSAPLRWNPKADLKCGSCGAAFTVETGNGPDERK